MRLFAVLSAAVLGGAPCAGAVSAQEVQERTIRWGHLNNTDHPVSFGVKKFAEILLPRAAASSRFASFAASQLGNELQQQSALRGGTQEMLSASTTSLAARRCGVRPARFPVHRQHYRSGRCAAQGAVRQGDDGQAAAARADRARLLGARLSQRHQQQASDRQARGFRRPEASRDPEPGLSGILQRLQGESDSDGVRRTLLARWKPARSTARRTPIR